MSVINGSIGPRPSESDLALGNVVADLAREAVLPTPAVSGCEVAVLAARGKASARAGILVRAASDDFAKAMAAIQHESEEGPTEDALRAARPVAVADLDTEPVRWPVFTAAARAYGLRSLHAEPLTPSGRGPIGVITWYAKVPGLFGLGYRADLIDRTDSCAMTLALARRFLDLHLAPQDLAATLASRVVLDEAIGILMQRHSCDAATAFARLRTAATADGMALHVYASVLVDRAARNQLADR